MSEDIVKLVIVDDHPLIIQGLEALIQPHDRLEITESFTNGEDFLAHIKDHTVHVVILDVSLPDRNGMDLCRDIKSISPDTKVIALSNHSERSIIMQMLQNGANGYLLKNSSAEELISGVNMVLEGHLAFSAEVQELIIRPVLNEDTHVLKLTRREQEVLKLIAEGDTTNGIAERLFVSPLTIETHRRNLLQKFKAKNVAEMIKSAFQQGLL